MPQSRIWLVSTPSPELDALRTSIRPRIEVLSKEGVPEDLSHCLLLWIHAAPGQDEPGIEGGLERIRDFVEQGGRLLLTGSVAALLGPLGVESCPPRRSVRVFEGNSTGEARLGLACFLDHPLFSRFPGGLYLRRPYPGCRIGGALYEGGEAPKEGRLLAVERSADAVDRNKGLLVEHRLGKGRILSLGAHLVFQVESPWGGCFLEERLRFTGDMVDYLCSAGSEWEGLAWPVTGSLARQGWGQVEGGLAPVALKPPRSTTEVSSVPLASSQWRVAFGKEGAGLGFSLRTSQGAILKGTGAEGVGEAWGLPLRFLDSFRFEGRGFEVFRGLERLPFAFRREMGGEPAQEGGKGAGTAWSESWTVAGPRSFYGRLENRGEGRQAFTLCLGGGLRLAAPYPPGSLAAAGLRHGEKGRSFEFFDRAAGFCARLDFSKEFEGLALEGQGARVSLVGSLGAGQSLEWGLSFGGSSQEAREAQEEVAGRGFHEHLEAEAKAYASWREKGLRVRFGKEMGEEFEAQWARLRDFFVEVPQGPQGARRAGIFLDAEKGGGQFRGAQGLWLCRFLLSNGFFEEVREHLELLAQHQGPSGEIPSQLSPAGPVDYALADTTPLFVELLGRYVAWSGDRDFAERLFPALRRALAFLEESDRDGDGIAEDQGLGPAWVKEGPLREEVIAEVYLVALQAAALDAGARLAEVLNVPGGGREWRRQEAQLREHLQRRFFDEERGLFAHGLRRDGSFDRRESALSLFPLLVGCADPGQAAKVLARLGEVDFSGPRGLRLLPNTDPDFDPDSEMAGKAVPLLGFLLSLAELLHGYGERGMRRIFGLLGNLDPWGLEGEQDRLSLPVGLALQGEAFLGAQPRLEGNGLGLRLTLPSTKEEVSFEGLRFRGLRLSGRAWRVAGREEQGLELKASGRGEIQLDLGIWIPKAYEVEKARQGKEELAFFIEPGPEGRFLVGKEFALAAGDRIEWKFQLRKVEEEPAEARREIPSGSPGDGSSESTSPSSSLDGPGSKARLARPGSGSHENRRSLRIAHVCHGYPPEFHGGTEHYVQGLAQAQKEEGHSPLVIAGRGEAVPGVLREEHDGIPVFRLGKDLLFHERWYHGFSPQVLGELLGILEKEEVDLVHIHHWMRLSFDLGAWVRAFGVPTVVTLHDLSTTCPRALRIREDRRFCEEGMGEERCLPCAPHEDWMRPEDLGFLLDWFSFAQERELRVGGALLAPSKAQSRFLQEQVETDLELRVLPHGCLPSVRALQEAPKPPPWEGQGPLRVAYWGHVQPLKGVHLILEAVGRLADPKAVQIQLWGEADDPFYASQIEELGKDLDLVWRRRFEPGDLVDLEADLAIFPSLARETWSFVLDEAFAKGLPVLCSDRGALPERVGRGGAVFGAGDVEELARLLGGILQDPGILKGYREHLSPLEPMDGHAAQLEEIYLGLIGPGMRDEELSEMRKETLDLLEDLKRWEEITRRHEERCRELAGLREKAESERGHLEDELREAMKSIEEHKKSIEEHKDRLARDESEIKKLLEQRETMQEEHQAVVRDFTADLEQHKKELKRAREDFRKTEAYLIESKALLEKRDAEISRAYQDLRKTHEEVEKAKNEVEEGKRRIQACERDLEELRVSLHEVREAFLACSRRERKLRRENRFAFLLTFPAKILFGLWDRIRGGEKT